MAFREAQPGGSFKPEGLIIQRLNRASVPVAKNPDFTPSPSSDIVRGTRMSPIDSSAEAMIGQNTTRDGGILNATIAHPGRPHALPDNGNAPARTPEQRPRREKKSTGKAKAAAIVIGGGTLLGGTSLAVMYETGLLDALAGNGDSNKTIVRDAGDLAKSNPPTTPDGKQIIIGETPTANPTNAEKTVTAAPTPDAPRTVAWTKDQIDAAQREATAQGKISMVNTWADQGMMAVDSISAANGKSIIVITKDPSLPSSETPVYESSFEGTVTDIVGGSAANVVYITVNGQEVKIYFDASVKPLVQKGQKVTYGTQIVPMGAQLTSSLGFKDAGNIAIIAANGSLTHANILHDQNGADVTLQK